MQGCSSAIRSASPESVDPKSLSSSLADPAWLDPMERFLQLANDPVVFSRAFQICDRQNPASVSKKSAHDLSAEPVEAGREDRFRSWLRRGR